MPWKDGYTISDEISLADNEVRWPDGNQLCMTITVDLSVASGPSGITPRDLASPRAQFGAHEGLEQVLRVLRRFGLRATLAAPAVIARIQSDRLRDLAAEDHEIAAHGLRHEDVSALEREEEAVRIQRTVEILSDVLGERPAGWFSLPRQGDPFAVGTISASTMDLLIEAGFEYMGNGLADDIPHWWVTDFASRRAILTLPYYYHYDDQFFLMFPSRGTGLEHPDSLFRNWRAEFNAQYKRGRQFHMTLHPYAVGWAHRVELLEEFLAYAHTFAGVWHPTAVECARYWKQAYPASASLHLEPSIWRDYPGSLS